MRNGCQAALTGEYGYACRAVYCCHYGGSRAVSPVRLVLTGLVAIIMFAVFAGCSREKPEKKRPSQVTADHAAWKIDNGELHKKILLVHSYHPEYPWVASITKGVQETLAASSVQLEIFYMDTKRRTSESWKVRAGELAQQKVAEFKPDLVIAVDDNAQQYFGKAYVGKELPIVFCGVNADPSKYGYPAKNVTGIIERANFKGTLEYLRLVKPIHKVAVFSSDDPTSRGALNFMKQDYVDADVEFKLVHDFDTWKKTVKEYNETTDAFGIYTYHTVSPGADSYQSIDPREVMEWTIQNTTVPTFGFFDFGIEDGLLMGVVESGYEHGEKAARYAIDILSGMPVSSLPVVKAKIGQKMINKVTAEKLGITLTEELTRNAIVVPKE